MQSYINKTTVLLTCFVLILFLCGMAGADTVTWTGNGTDNFASNSANWSGEKAPQDGDDVIFNSTNEYCTWNYSVFLASFTKTSGYTGEITKTLTSSGTYVNLTVAKLMKWTGNGTDSLASNPDNWSLGRAPQTADRLVFNDNPSPNSNKNALWDLPTGVTPALMTISSGYTGEVKLNTAFSTTGNLNVLGGTFDLNDKTLSVDGYILIGLAGTINATSSTITVKGDWLNSGLFIYGTSTVVLAGTNRVIYGDTTFYNLVKTVTSADTLFFQAGSTQTIKNNLTLQGSADNLLSLRSTENGSYWYINPLGASNLLFVNIMDMNNISFVNVVPLNSEDEGHNEGASFGGSECVCIEDDRIHARLFYGDRRVTC